jgi:predicted DNA-binding transcriptional regulator YafY
MLITPELVEIDYTNYSGKRGKRVVEPQRIWFGSNEWHSERQWLLDAYDVDKGENRTFTMIDIHSWQAATRTE